MLIAQVFPVISVYTLSGGQYAYHSEDGSIFRDFHVRRGKVMRALHWLKANNKFYRDIDIDDEILQTLVRLRRNFHNSRMIELIVLKKNQMMKMRTKMMKTLSTHKHLFLHYPPDLMKIEQLMKFSIKRNMITRELTGHITKFLQLMSLIPSKSISYPLSLGSRGPK
jgi:hypothetical protein